MSAIVRWATENPLLALMAALALVVVGIVAMTRIPIDAVPDVTNIQVQVVTRAPALSAAEVETQVTQPVERAMAGTPGLRTVRSVTKVGISVVTLIFGDEVDVYFARTQVAERLVRIRDEMPSEIGTPELGPIATALGEIYMFELKQEEGSRRSNEELRTIVDWQIGPRLRQVRGVIEVIGSGGEQKQYRVTLDPARLAAHGISVEEVRRALEQDNVIAGGGYVEKGREQVVLRGNARFKGLEDISSTLVRTDGHGTPVRVGQLGKIDTGPALRYGAMTRDGRGEVVGGSVLMLKGENTREVVRRVKAAIEELGPRLPRGVVIDPYYDRADFIHEVLHTIAKNLTEGALLVVGCLFLTLGTLRAGLLVAAAIPFSMLVGIAGLKAIGYTGNVMSLGAIDFGIVVEGTVVMVEHVVAHLGDPADRERCKRAIARSMQDVARPVVFGVVIVLLVFLPLGTLEDVEGKMFRPVVFSLCFILLGALVYSLLVIPAIAVPILSGTRKVGVPFLLRVVHGIYEPNLRRALRRPGRTTAIAFGVVAVLLAPGARLGAEFLPRIFEGSFAIDALRPPSVSLTQAIDMANETELALLDVPEVRTVVDRIGRSENAVDPAGPESSDVFVILKPRDQWRQGIDQEKLVGELSRRVSRRVPATINAFSQPIEMRVNDILAGVRSDVAIKVFGDELEAMNDAADKILKTIAQIAGTSDAKMEIVGGLPSILVTPDRSRAARLGISSRSILDVLTMTRGGQTVGRVREGERVFDLSLRIGGERVTDPEDLERLPVATTGEALVPLAVVANVAEERTVVQIGREQMRRRLVVQCNVRGRDIVGFVQEAQSKVTNLALPNTVELSWGGQFQNYDRAKSDLVKLVPVSIGIIAVMLAIAFGNVRYMLVTLLSLAFALAGGVAALVVRGLPFSIPAGVGFIALSGVAVMNGVVMVTNLRRRPEDEPIEERVTHAALVSLRAIFSTALVAAVGFVPAAIATGMGAEIQRPLATVVIGGIIAAMLLSLVALPAMLLLSSRRRAPGQKPQPPGSAAPC